MKMENLINREPFIKEEILSDDEDELQSSASSDIENIFVKRFSDRGSPTSQGIIPTICPKEYLQPWIDTENATEFFSDSDDCEDFVSSSPVVKTEASEMFLAYEDYVCGNDTIDVSADESCEGSPQIAYYILPDVEVEKVKEHSVDNIATMCISNKLVETDANVESPRPFECTYCERVFSSKDEKVIHEYQHSKKEKRYPYIHAKVPTAREPPEIRHGEWLERPYCCTYCKLDFVTKADKFKHELEHRKKKTFQCSYCPVKLRSNHQKVVHERMHTGEKPFACTYCDMKFRDNRHRMAHERKHTDEKPFECTYCSLKFWLKHDKIVHERIHTGEKPFPCRFCSKAFGRSIKRTEHEWIHTGEKPFPCQYCDKRFRSRTAQQNHENTHTGARPYACPFCDKCFSSRNGLNVHKSKHVSEVK